MRSIKFGVFFAALTMLAGPVRAQTAVLGCTFEGATEPTFYRITGGGEPTWEGCDSLQWAWWPRACAQMIGFTAALPVPS